MTYCNNKIQDNNTTDIPECLHMPSTQCNHQNCPHTFSIYVVNNQLHLRVHPCSDDVKRQWQHCWYGFPIQIIYPKMFFHTQKQPVIRWGEILSVGGMCQPSSPNVAPDSAHYNGNEVLHCPGAKWHHAQAVLVVFGKEQASPYSARVYSNTGH